MTKAKGEKEIFGYDGEGPFTQAELAEIAAKLRADLAPHDRPGSATQAARETNEFRHISHVVESTRRTGGTPSEE